MPLFNSGRFEACFSAYRMALRSLQLLAPDSIPAQVVKEALERAAGEDVERGAWTLRYSLDEVYRMSGSKRGMQMQAVPFALEFDQSD